MEILVGFFFTQIADFGSAQSVRGFLAQALRVALGATKLQGRIQVQEASLCLEVQGTQEEILSFSQNLQDYIPLSLQWTFSEMKILESPAQKESHTAVQEKSLNEGFLTPLELRRITDRESLEFCNLWGDFIGFKQSKITFLKGGQRLEITDSASLAQSLQECAKMLENGECVFLKTIFGKFEARLFREEFENPPARDFYFMPFSLASAKLIFKTENEELQALATLEKPSIILSPKGIFAAHFLHHARVILPYEPFLALLARFLESYQGFYLLPINDNTEKLENGICEFVECEQSPLCISVAKNGLIVPHTYRSSHPHAHLQTLQETMRAHKLERTNALYLGRNPTQFFVYFDGKLREALSFCFESNLGVIVATLESLNETTQSLLRNFTKENADLVARLRTLSRDSKESRNLLDLLGMVGVLLDLGTEEDLRDSCMQVLRVAGEFMGAKGPRIDFRLERNESGIFLNTLWTLRSVMSFKLAGVERELLCFGVLDSLAEFFANLSRDMNENYQTQDIVVCGELFLERQFLNQFVHYLPKTSEVYPSLVMEFVDS